MVREPRFELGSQPWQGRIITTELLAHHKLLQKIKPLYSLL